MFTDNTLRSPKAYKCGLWFASLSEDIKTQLCLA